MVKITNAIGDIKTGVQGEAVYQGKYGQQIRRTRQPKRGIVSEKQEQHRQTYRAALDWRKSLSLPNRRFLESYCISSWVVDRYKIPLPWHRFALKLYLEHLYFVPELTTKELVGKEAVDQKYTTGDTAAFYLNNTVWMSQTFTPAITGKLTKIKFKLYRPYYFDDYIIKIATTDGDGYPTNNVLFSKIFSSELITEEEPGDWYEYAFDAPATLTKEVVYASIMHGLPNGVNPKLYWREDPTAPEYYRGCVYRSSNSGNSWTRYLYDELMFQTFVFIPGKKLTYGTLYVRHPAIKSFNQKRNGIIIRAEGNLSSLDDHYLTKQVELDVEKGDEIEATTVAGILYKHLV
ncbi:hypothetical protein ES708_19125 [subsurface metagenome]